jgi:hypothetical protein
LAAVSSFQEKGDAAAVAGPRIVSEETIDMLLQKSLALQPVRVLPAAARAGEDG